MKHFIRPSIFPLFILLAVCCPALAQTTLGAGLTYNMPMGDLRYFAKPAVGYELGARYQAKRLFVDLTAYYMEFTLNKTGFSYTNTQNGGSEFTSVTLNPDWDFYGLTLSGGYNLYQKGNSAVYAGIGVCYLYGFREVHEYTDGGTFSTESSAIGSSGKFGLVPRLGAKISAGRFRFLPEVRTNLNDSNGFSNFTRASSYDLGARDPFLQFALGLHYVL